MYGSGKSYLGLNFLEALNSDSPVYMSIKNNLKIEYPNELPILLAAKYLELNLKDISGRLSKDNYIFPMVLLMGREALRQFKEHEKFLDLKNYIENTWSSIPISEFVFGITKILGHYIFCHIDEIDVICEKEEEQEVKVKCYYQFWRDVLTPIIWTGTPVYVSGRSSILFSLGKNLYHELKSPTACNCRTLNPLTQSNINDIIEKKNLKYRNIPTISKEIYHLTAGIPRLVLFAIRYLEKYGYDGKTFGQNLFQYINPFELGRSS